jgi:hypothetical protein
MRSLKDGVTIREGQETTQLPVTKVTVFNFHFGRWRGLTWHDKNNDIVWLLGVGWHESGSNDDAYEVLKRRDISGKLMPTDFDFEDLELSYDESLTFVKQVDAQAPALIEEARLEPGVLKSAVIAGRIGVGVVVNVVVIDNNVGAEEIYIGFELPPVEGPCNLPPQAEWLGLILAAMLPNANFLEIEFDKAFPSPDQKYAMTAYWSAL